jgi:hypothetical protein
LCQQRRKQLHFRLDPAGYNMSTPGRGRLVTLLAIVAAIAVVVMVFKLGKMNAGTGRGLKSTSVASTVRHHF